jgi:hypothetical protein
MGRGPGSDCVVVALGEGHEAKEAVLARGINENTNPSNAGK